MMDGRPAIPELVPATPPAPRLGACNFAGCTGHVVGRDDAFCEAHWRKLLPEFRMELLGWRNKVRRHPRLSTEYFKRILGAGVWLARAA